MPAPKSPEGAWETFAAAADQSGPEVAEVQALRSEVRAKAKAGGKRQAKSKAKAQPKCKAVDAAWHERHRDTLCLLPAECQPANMFHGEHNYTLTGANNSRIQ
eukprot:12445882-Alexandrium_andersonii.AAC.1